MRIGLLGPAAGDEGTLREAAEFLLGDAGVDQAIYLGDDLDTLDAVVKGWRVQLLGGDDHEIAFLDEAVRVACEGGSDEIQSLLERDVEASRLSALRAIPASPARAVEMVEDRIIILVHDKSVLDEEDIANAQLIVYGLSEKAELRRFGPRYFLTPGPLDAGQVAMIEVEPDGRVTLALYESSGVPVWRETMSQRASKMMVTT